MALFTESELLSSRKSYRDYFEKSASTIILEERKVSIDKSFDIFLSHSYLDKDIILGLKAELEKLNYSVYVDWIEDEDLDRRKVTKETAATIRKRMQNSKSLLFATSTNSSYSKWMPWECGYFDGLKNKVAILPIAKQSQSTYSGQEYLGLYPYIDKATAQGNNSISLWVNESSDVYVEFSKWLQGQKPVKHNS